MGDSLCAGLCFLPIVIAVTDKVRGRRVAKFAGEVFCQNFGLTDIGEILRLVAVFVVVGFGRNIAVLLADL